MLLKANGCCKGWLGTVYLLCLHGCRDVLAAVGTTLVHTPIERFLAASFDFLALLSR
jgi:hypothetical protein